ncbi:MAG TPA: choice-of-anchor X domain-containing protein [Phycisphaerales bacterium]|nr:choice-of-anchor X domain-containing protein [Phycisphaerales bacterium]
MMQSLSARTLACLALMLPATSALAQVRISMVGKDNSPNVNDFNGQFVELFNAGTTDVVLDGKSVQWASSAGGSSWAKIDLTGTIAAGRYRLIRITSHFPFTWGIPFEADQTIPAGFNGQPITSSVLANFGKMVLADTTTLFTTNGCAAPNNAQVIDLVSWGTTPSTSGCFEGSGIAVIPSLSGIGVTAVTRRCGGLVDSNNNAVDFMETNRPPRNSFWVGLPDEPAVNGITEVIGKSGTSITTGYAGQSVSFTTKPVSCGGTLTSVRINLSPIGGGVSVTMRDDGLAGDATAGDGVYTYVHTLPPTAPTGTYQIEIAASDSTGRIGRGFAPLILAPTPPANDACANAEFIPSSMLPVNVSATGNIVSATPITPITASCATTPATSRDVWYSFTPMETGFYTITTCNEVTAPTSLTGVATHLSLFTACPPANATDLTGQSIACNQFACRVFIGGGPSTIFDTPLEAGTQYLIRVARAASGDSVAGGPFRLDITSEPFGACCATNGTCITTKQSTCEALGRTFYGAGTSCTNLTCPAPQTPSNDECPSAVPLALGVVESEVATTFGATGQDITLCDQTSWDVWYTFTPEQAGDYVATVTLTNGIYTPGISLFDTCPPVANAELGCVTVSNISPTNSLAFNAAAGSPLYIRVATYFSQRSEFTVVVNPVLACDDIDFNNNEVFPEDQDVIDFFNVLAGAECPACNDIDFNNNDVFPEDQDVIDFFNVLAGGACP